MAQMLFLTIHRGVWVGWLFYMLRVGIGQAGQKWKAIKANKSGKHSNLSSEKMKKQAVVSAAYSHQKNEACRKELKRLVSSGLMRT